MTRNTLVYFYTFNSTQHACFKNEGYVYHFTQTSVLAIEKISLKLIGYHGHYSQVSASVLFFDWAKKCGQRRLDQNKRKLMKKKMMGQYFNLALPLTCRFLRIGISQNMCSKYGNCSSPPIKVHKPHVKMLSTEFSFK